MAEKVNVKQAVDFAEDMQGVLRAGAGRVTAEHQPQLQLAQNHITMVPVYAQAGDTNAIREAYLAARDVVNASPAYTAVGTAKSPSGEINSLADVANGIVATVLPSLSGSMRQPAHLHSKLVH